MTNFAESSYLLRTKPIILIVDDIPENLQILSNKLDAAGFDTSFAISGQEALDTIEVLLPDLILLDISMPEMSGFEVCRRLKLNENTKDIPVIFLTAYNDRENIISAFEVGGVDYISKPFNQMELYARIRNHLSLRQKTIQLEIVQKTLVEIRQEQSTLYHITKNNVLNPLKNLKILNGEAFNTSKDLDDIIGYVENISNLQKVENLDYSNSLQKVSLLEILDENELTHCFDTEECKNIYFQTDIETLHLLFKTLVKFIKSVSTEMKYVSLQFENYAYFTTKMNFRQKVIFNISKIKDDFIQSNNEDKVFPISTILDFGQSGFNFCIAQKLARTLQGNLSLETVEQNWKIVLDLGLPQIHTST